MVGQANVREFNADRAICDAATPGPWYANLASVRAKTDGRLIADYVFPNDARFIAEARTGWPAALDEIERLRGVLERMDDRVHPMLPRSEMAKLAKAAIDGSEARSTYVELREMQAEIQRYRQALESLLSVFNGNYITKNKPSTHVDAAIQKAKEALSHGETEN